MLDLQRRRLSETHHSTVRLPKKMIKQDGGEVHKLPITWFHVNTYENFDLGTQFGLHG